MQFALQSFSLDFMRTLRLKEKQLGSGWILFSCPVLINAPESWILMKNHCLMWSLMQLNDTLHLLIQNLISN